MTKILIVILTGLLISTPVSAQLMKCKDPQTGKVTFSDRQCPTSEGSSKINLPPPNTVENGHLRQRAADDKSDEMMRQDGPSAIVIGQQPTRNECNEAEKDYQEAKSKQSPPSTMQPLKNRVQVACSRAPAGSSPSRPVASLPTNTPAPKSMNCDASGCWDNLGGRYNKGAGTTYFPASGGGSCQLIGGMMQCQ